MPFSVFKPILRIEPAGKHLGHWLPPSSTKTSSYCDRYHVSHHHQLRPLLAVVGVTGDGRVGVPWCVVNRAHMWGGRVIFGGGTDIHARVALFRNRVMGPLTTFIALDSRIYVYVYVYTRALDDICTTFGEVQHSSSSKNQWNWHHPKTAKLIFLSFLHVYQLEIKVTDVASKWYCRRRRCQCIHWMPHVGNALLV